MNHERLSKVAALLEARPASAPFTMGVFAFDDGSAACALGGYVLAGCMPGYELRFIKSPYPSPTEPDRLYASLVPSVAPRYALGIAYDSAEVCEHFEIDEETAFELFNPEGCGKAKTAAAAAAYIRELLVLEAA